MIRFGISNLIFGSVSQACRDALLDASDICDFAPTVHYGSWDEVPEVIPFKPYEGRETQICALQSLFYGLPDVSLLKDGDSFNALVAHCERLAAWAARSNIPNLIYGSPGTRSGRVAHLSDTAMRLRVEKLAHIVGEHGVRLCFEVNSPKFGCEFLASNAELMGLLAQIDHPGLGLHLDVGQMFEEGLPLLSYIEEHALILSHLHLSAPDFTCDPSMLPLYTQIIHRLKSANVEVDVVLEVQQLGRASELQLVAMCEQLAISCQ